MQSERIDEIIAGKLARVAEAVTQDIKGIGISDLSLNPGSVARCYNVTESQALRVLHIVRDNGIIRDGKFAKNFQTN